MANSEDTDQTPHSVESDPGLRCLPMSQKLDAMLIWVNLSAFIGANVIFVGLFDVSLVAIFLGTRLPLALHTCCTVRRFFFYLFPFSCWCLEKESDGTNS